MAHYEHLPIYREAFNNFHFFETAINQVTDISRQTEWWLKGARKKRLGQNPCAEGPGRRQEDPGREAHQGVGPGQQLRRNRAEDRHAGGGPRRGVQSEQY